ncbi:hypothetical protein [Methanobrevibacter ruminantium]|uniref:hypothetical protein n=1 Tax=Methanobrevibacter ruminantium TaxID=83816 RepID=UPI0026EAC672|nr:hypothetical protein [Methanobrevibacter ruminantium]
MGDNDNYKKLRKPYDISLPFFAYGVLKPGEIAYSRIKDLIYEKNEACVNYSMKHRDGVPILLSKEMDFEETCGYIFHFSDGDEAYKTIIDTISGNLYKWGTIDIGKEKANVLFGRNPSKGSNYIEDEFDRKCYSGKNDPLFKEGIQLVKENLESGIFRKEKGFFNLQMNYMLLWSAIDRYSKLRYYRKKEHESREELSKEKVFRKALNIYAGGKHYRPIYNTDNLFKNVFDLSNPKYCLNYYYTLRCNIVHRGKSSFNDIGLLMEATEDLLNIFEYMLDDAFGEE